MKESGDIYQDILRTQRHAYARSQDKVRKTVHVHKLRFRTSAGGRANASIAMCGGPPTPLSPPTRHPGTFKDFDLISPKYKPLCCGIHISITIMDNSATSDEVRDVARRAVATFAANGLRCCLFGSAACQLYGNSRKPNVSYRSMMLSVILHAAQSDGCRCLLT